MSLIEARATAPSGRAIMVLACGLALFGGFLPILVTSVHNDEMAWLCLALPITVFALFLAAPEAFAITPRRSGVRKPNLLPAVSLMGLIVSVKRVAFLTLGPALTFAGFGAAIALVLGLGVAGRRLPGQIWLWALLLVAYGGTYGYGATLFADTYFDRDPGQIFRARVERQYTSGGRSSAPHLVLAPWGPTASPTDIVVSWPTYQSLRVGDTACVTLRAGELSMPWYKAASCDPS